LLSGVTLKTKDDLLAWAVLASGAYAALGITRATRNDGDEDVATASEVADDLMMEARRRVRRGHLLRFSELQELRVLLGSASPEDDALFSMLLNRCLELMPMSESEFAEWMQVPPPHVNLWRHNKHLPDQELRQAIFLALRKDVETLLRNSGYDVDG